MHTFAQLVVYVYMHAMPTCLGIHVALWQPFSGHVQDMICKAVYFPTRGSNMSVSINIHAIMVTMEKVKKFIEPADWKMVVLELIKLCFPRAVKGLDQPYIFDSGAGGEDQPAPGTNGWVLDLLGQAGQEG